MAAPFIISDEAGRQHALDRIAGLDLDEKRWEITVKRHRKRRSTKQNRMYWNWCEEVAGHVSEYTGYDKDEIHEFFKQNFLPGRRIEIEGMEAVRFTTTKLDTKQMSDYCDRIFRWASVELGLALPLPPEIIEEGYDGPPRPTNDADDDWQTIASDIVKEIGQAPNRGRLDEITALWEAELSNMEKNAPAHYTRVMRAMELRGLDLDGQNPAGQSPQGEPVRQEAGAG
jgi:hypothetical protein